jgi:ACR3 family arsenite efflux pump ArsB
MTTNNPLNDLAEIRSIMERSTKFLSMSAASAAVAGVYALGGAALAWNVLRKGEHKPSSLLLIAVAIFLMALSTTIWMSYRKAQKAGQKLWNRAAVRLFVNFALPMTAGGIFVLLLYTRGFYSLIAASTLLFYGLALLNAGNFTFSDIRKLGIAQMALGLLAAALPGQGLLFWTLGFGLLHIIYGGVMYWKYEKA